MSSMFNGSGGYRLVGVCSLLIALIGVHFYTLLDDEPEIPETPPTLKITRNETNRAEVSSRL
jgi:hypothetical protein